MAYSKQTWTDNSTQANKTRMDHIEDGIFAAAATADTAASTATTAASSAASAVTSANAALDAVDDVVAGITVPINYVMWASYSGGTAVRPSSDPAQFVLWLCDTVAHANALPLVTTGTTGRYAIDRMMANV